MDSVSVIIVNWNGGKSIEECLNGLRNQTFKDFSSIVIDNASQDGSLELVQNKYPEVVTISLDENMGFAAANNIVLESIGTEYVALLNNDAVPHPSWLEHLLKALRQNPEIGFAASKMLLHDDPEIIDRAGDVYTTAGTALLRGRGYSLENYGTPEWVFGACAGAAMYRKRMLDDIGFFDEDFFLLYEDVDLSFRAQLQGYKCVYVPDALVYHYGSSSIGSDTPVSVYYSHRNLEWVYIKNMPAGLILKTIVPHLIYDIGAFFFFLTCGKGKIHIKAKRDALRGLKKALQKRRQIQSNRKVDAFSIWEILEKEEYLPRLKRRFTR